MGGEVMALTVGTDSYISVADADSYFADRLFADSWTAATVTQKEQALKMATKKIDQQRLRGFKAVPSQTLEFPRALYSYSYRGSNRVVGVNVNDGPGWVIESEVTDSVKFATCEEAKALLERGSQAHKRADLQRQGVTSFSLGSLSESYSGAFDGGKLLSSDAAQYLLQYTSGGRVIM